MGSLSAVFAAPARLAAMPQAITNAGKLRTNLLRLFTDYLPNGLRRRLLPHWPDNGSMFNVMASQKCRRGACGRCDSCEFAGASLALVSGRTGGPKSVDRYPALA